MYSIHSKQVTNSKGFRYDSFAFFVLMVLSSLAFAQTTRLTASDAEPDDNFGYSLAVSGNTLVAGAWQNDSLRANSGAAYIFEWGAENGWQLVTKLTPDNADFAGDEFGKAVAIDANLVIVGAQFDDEAGKDRGAAYVFERNSDGDAPWMQVAKLAANDAEFRDFFGHSVAISGELVVVGAPEDDDMGKQSGSAYVFERSATDNRWAQVAKLTANDGEANDGFGRTVAVAGNTILVGANEHSHEGINNNGAAYVFEKDQSGSWQQVAKLTAHDGDELDRFGSALALQANLALVGAPFDDDSENAGGSAYLFERSMNGDWSQIAKLTADDPHLGNQFGHAVAFFNNQALIGSPGHDEMGKESGIAYLFQQDATGWQLVQTFSPDDAAAYDLFGYAVALGENLALVGAHEDDEQGKQESGSANLFQLP